jgi:hypothetical protein
MWEKFYDNCIHTLPVMYTFHWNPISVGIGPQQGKIQIDVVGLIA